MELKNVKSLLVCLPRLVDQTTNFDYEFFTADVATAETYAEALRTTGEPYAEPEPIPTNSSRNGSIPLQSSTVLHPYTPPEGMLYTIQAYDINKISHKSRGRKL